ncbi:uncharacterized protein K441DRAFT_671048 [Cenococcum geophilum 1.58]|uniref:Uncharacterized protein n=1 Tax=Cenococcum geophilum 1.58 TaxID=794803 RepID=A0ACC8EM18_9PEZI|nr:hypothetical protein K441DRAFT_671048 [Cenococcum geophilum 1.58]
MARPNLRPRPKPSKALFPFLALPTELRLQIYNYLLLSGPSYCYTHADLLSLHLRQRRRRSPFSRHSMLLANRQLHAEYMQAFYERTSFSFYIDTDNGRRSATVPFLTLPPALLRNLRTCRLWVDLGMMMGGLDPPREASVAQVEALLGRMERVRSVHIVWGPYIMMRRPLYNEELWERLGERFVQRLKGGAGMQEITVVVGNRFLRLRREGAKWVERGVKVL